ncbi:MAG: hypothetical protein H6937_03220 [Burkholderiales bacterium]|nr:hypothetical protein [Burkholderiales bacterium]
MSFVRQLLLLTRITRSHHIARRYFVVNGFDGALTMLGLLIGFYVSGQVVLPVVISVCLGAAIALGMSGMTSAYISEAAEKKRELKRLEKAMIADLGESAYGHTTRLMPLLIALLMWSGAILDCVIHHLAIGLGALAAATCFPPARDGSDGCIPAYILIGRVSWSR